MPKTQRGISGEFAFKNEIRTCSKKRENLEPNLEKADLEG